MSNDKWLEEINQKVEEEQRNYKGPYCCLTMHSELHNGSNLLGYNARYREYGINISKPTKCLLMDYCIACGKKLPHSLRNEWLETLKQEYKLENPTNKDKKRIPEEFLTDEWWKIKNNINNQQLFDLPKKTNVHRKKNPHNHEYPHCCTGMYCELLSNISILEYNAKYREYAIKIPRSSQYALIDYCLFCGTKMPKSLRHEWYDILEQEYKLENPMEEDRKKVPKEFLTDEWWKKRGL